MSSDDEDLKRAIALSLAEANSGTGSQEPIIISSDDEEPTSMNHPYETGSQSKDPVVSAIDPTPGTSAFLSERAELEAARLARLKRRRESQFGPSAPSSSKAPSDDPFVSSDDDSELPMKRSKLTSSVQATTMSKLSNSTTGAKTEGLRSRGSAEENMFWDGELRQIANAHVDRTQDTRPTFRLHDILGDKSELVFCILSSFVTQLSWIYSIIPQTIPVLLISQPGDDGEASVHNVLPNWVKVTPYLRGGRGCMHMKFMLLFYKSGRVRVVITTANLMDYDWRDIENSAWLQDIPPLQHPSQGVHSNDFASYFESVLVRLNVPQGLQAIRIEHPGIPLKIVTDLRKGWDFRKVTVMLVASVAGKHEGWPKVTKVGHTRLMRVVKTIGACADADDSVGGFVDRNGKQKAGIVKRVLQLECQTSSVGTYTPAWIDEFFTSARGASPEDWLDSIKSKRFKEIEARVKHRGWPAIKIIFPSLLTVKRSHLGEEGAGTMFCRHKQWNGAKFPREIFHDSNSRRGPVLMHSKMILATFKCDDSTSSADSKPQKQAKKTLHSSWDDDASETELSSDTEIEEVNPEWNNQTLGWVYVGSHNFTPSAWGTLSGSKFTPIMNIANYELGIVFPLTTSAQADEIALWNRPPRKYDLRTDEPWMQN